MQETLLDELSTTRLVRLHGHIGEALEERYGERAEEQAPALARHFVESAALNTEHATKALRYSRAAGEEALERLAWDEAAAHFEHALEQAETVATIEPLNQAALQDGIGRAYLSMGKNDEAFRALESAFRIYADANDAERVFQVTFTIGTNIVLSQRERSEHFNREALSLQAENSSRRGMIETFIASQLGYRGEVEEGLARATTAQSIADALGDKRLALAAMVCRGHVLGYNEQGEPGLVLRTAELAEKLGDSKQACKSHAELAWGAGYYLGDLDQGLIHAEKARLAAEETRVVDDRVTAACAQLIITYIAGRLSDVDPLERMISLDLSQFWGCYYLYPHRLFTADDAGALRTLTTAEKTVAPGSAPSLFLAEASVMFATWWWQTGDERFLDLADAGCLEMNNKSLSAVDERMVAPALGLVALGSGDEAKMHEWHDAPDELGGAAVPFLSAEQVKGLVDEELGQEEEALEHYETAMESMNVSPTLWSLPAYERARLLVKLGRSEAAAAIAELLEVTTPIGMRRWQEKALALRVQLHGVTDSQQSIDVVAAAVQHELPDIAPQAAPDGTVTVMFSDIIDSTATNERLGDAVWMALLPEHNAVIREHVAANNGYEVKSMGDGFMLAFRSAKDGLNCAIGIQRAIASRNESADETVQVRIGLHTGEAVQEAGDFFGKHVNLAARIGGSATGGQILVSSLLAELVGPSGEFTLSARPAMSLKGLDGEHVTHGVEWR